MAELSDLKKALAPQPSSESFRQITQPLQEAARMRRQLAFSPLFETTRALNQDMLKSFNQVSKCFAEIGGKSALKDAMNSVTMARDLVGKTDLSQPVRPVGLSPEALAWQAEKAAAPVATRDAVLSLADAVESLAVSSRDADRKLIWLTAALTLMTAAVLALTVLLLLNG